MIYVYGDSFVADHGFGKSWPEMLSHKLNQEVLNRGIPGSSTEFSMKKFFEDIKNFKNNDIVLFSFSTTGRIHYKEINTHIPQSSCAPWNDDYDQWPWQKENKDHIKWHITNIDYDLLHINFEAYHQLIRSFAEFNKNITMIVLANTFHDNKYFLDTPSPDNYFRLPFDLLSISNAEYLDCDGYLSFITHTKYDPRVNHLTIPNMQILCDIVYDFITKQVRRGLKEDFIKKNIPKIKTLEQYYQCIDQGLIFENNAAKDRIKGYYL